MNQNLEHSAKVKICKGLKFGEMTYNSLDWSTERCLLLVSLGWSSSRATDKDWFKCSDRGRWVFFVFSFDLKGALGVASALGLGAGRPDGFGFLGRLPRANKKYWNFVHIFKIRIRGNLSSIPGDWTFLCQRWGLIFLLTSLNYWCGMLGISSRACINRRIWLARSVPPSLPVSRYIPALSQRHQFIQAITVFSTWKTYLSCMSDFSGKIA